jgi:ubiquinone/menaquinone biosynthesis C-methylase UbiE
MKETQMAVSSPKHPIFERFYGWISPRMDQGGVLAHRRRLLAGLSGRVIEVGSGNGLNFAHYPFEVSRVLAVEPSPHLRKLARDNAERALVPVYVADGDAEHLPADDEMFEAAVVSLVLCSVPDQRKALREIHRVLRPGGRLHFYEHVRGDTVALQRVQRLMDATIWPLLAGGCHTARDTSAAITNAGFEMQRVDRLRFPDSVVSMPSSPHILGVAVRPSG